LREFTEEMPKAMVPIGGKPILWHIMKIYATAGFTDFVLCTGYHREQIEEYFRKNNEDNWNIEFVDTGLESTKAERLRRIEKFMEGENEFFVAYGDDVSDVDVKAVLEFHRKSGKVGTLTTVNPESQFGVLDLGESGAVKGIREKPRLNTWINGGFFVFNRRIFDYLHKVQGELENEVFAELVNEQELVARKHEGFWGCMNTFKEWSELNELWKHGKAPWKKWE
ncbi:glucose-1-phosphate cytidylyltransferase, partial [Candidatus Micrarchaeota archaeon]|nr:glucose-1-phosphate cytidylyltransferase [Candidatus Micrarchaeota archaeon]